jgi:hypothetical protein
MKINFLQAEKKDNKFNFQDLKAGDLFAFNDPNTCKTDVYMKIGKHKDDKTTSDTVILETGKLVCFYDLKRETIVIDQLFVYKLNGEMQIRLDN